jgi:acetylglutamate kinase
MVELLNSLGALGKRAVEGCDVEGGDVEDIGILKQALPYIKRYRNTIFVIKLGGELLTDSARLDGIAADLSLMHQLSIKTVIVHGGGPQLSETAEKMGIESEKVNGRRITDDQMLEVAKMVFRRISTDLLAHLRRHGCPGVGLSGIDGDLIQATRRPKRKIFDQDAGKERLVDFKNVGDIVSVDTRIIEVLLENRFVPVIASLGADEDGQVLNINADTIAYQIAAELKAEKFFVLTNVSGVLKDIDDPSSRYSHLTIEGGRRLVDERQVKGGMIPKLNAAIDAVEGGVARAHIVNGMAENALLYEVFTIDGFGTMIVNKEEEATYLKKG